MTYRKSDEPKWAPRIAQFILCALLIETAVLVWLNYMPGGQG